MVNIAQYGLVLILSVLLVFHFLILLKIVPYNIIWGGRLKSNKEMYRFETVSILINFIFLYVVLVQSHFFRVDIPKNVMTISLWAMTALFAFNIHGNMMSKNKFEKRLFTPITIILTIFSLILALTN